jgi:hypothetical protein
MGKRKSEVRKDRKRVKRGKRKLETTRYGKKLRSRNRSHPDNWQV